MKALVNSPALRFVNVFLIAALTMALSIGALTPAHAASKIVAIVNGTPITSVDLNRRVNLLKLQRARGNIRSKALDQLIDDVLKREEILRLGVSVSTSDVDGAFERFAKGNKMSAKKLSQVLSQAGVTADHFKAYIASSMSWPRAVQARFGDQGGMSTSDFLNRLKEGEKPSTNEYVLQQIIFVVPAAKRNAIIGRRQREAEASRSKYPGCDDAKAFAATMHDVSVRSLGRGLEPQLPKQWKDSITKAKVGGTTKSQRTDKGVEYIGICKKRVVNDDVAAKAVFQAEELGKPNAENSKSEQYLTELRKVAQITKK